MQKRRGGEKKRKEKKYEKYSLIIQLSELSALSVFCEIQSIRYIHIDRFSQKRHSCRINGYIPCCGQEKRPRLNFVLERHFFLLSFFFVVSNFRGTRLYRDEIYRSVGQLSNRCNLRSKKIIFRFCSYIKYLNK